MSSTNGGAARRQRQPRLCGARSSAAASWQQVVTRQRHHPELVAKKERTPPLLLEKGSVAPYPAISRSTPSTAAFASASATAAMVINMTARPHVWGSFIGLPSTRKQAWTASARYQSHGHSTDIHTCEPCAMESAFRGDRLWSCAGRRQGVFRICAASPWSARLPHLRTGCPGVHLKGLNISTTAA
jgi:hypothetical protein